MSCFRMWVGLFLICSLLVTQTLACLVSVCELAWLLMCALLVTQMWPVFVSDGRLAWFLMFTLVITQTWLVLFQMVSWPSFKCALFWWHRCGLSCFSGWVVLAFDVHSSGDTDCGLSCFRMWVGMIFDLHSSGDTDCGLSCFRLWVGLVFDVHSSGDTHVAYLVLECELA